MKKILALIVAAAVIEASCIPALAVETEQTKDTGQEAEAKEQDADSGMDGSLDNLTSDELMTRFNEYNNMIAAAEDKKSSLNVQTEEQAAVAEECGRKLELVTEEYEEYKNGLEDEIKEYRSDLIKACAFYPFYKAGEYGGPFKCLKLLADYQEHFDAITEKYEEGFELASDRANEEEEKLKELQSELNDQAAYVDKLKKGQKEIEDKYYSTKDIEEKEAQEEEKRKTEEEQKKAEEEAAAKEAAEETTAVSGEVQTEAQTEEQQDISDNTATNEDNTEEAQENEWREGESFDSAAFYAKFGYTDSGYPLNKTNGVVYYNGHRETYYSERILPGYGLNIPGRYTDEQGIVRDGDGYICVASSDLAKGTTIQTSLGLAKVYDSGCASGTIDIYVNW